ncbi:MAG: hypothetical protein JNM00_04645, partial [Flavobacteriales bacterium]|nr:hypothetical protein [Flavobacteriales bacterium]
MNRITSFLSKPVLLFAAAVMVLSSCTKEERHTGMPIAMQGKKAKLTDEQVRRVEDVSSRIPMLRFFDEERNRFID